MARYFGWMVFGLCLLSVTLWWQWPKEELRVTFCDVGQGDGAVIQSSFTQILVDTGPPGGKMVACLGKVLPFWDRQIETVVISHADVDHSGGLTEILKRYQVKQVVVSEANKEEIQSVLNKSTTLVISGRGDNWRWGNISGEVIWPPFVPAYAGTTGGKPPSDLNNLSLVWRMEYGGHSVWWAGDVDEGMEKLMMEAGRVEPTEVLKISHHGSKTASSDRFLTILQPRQIVISVGKNNRYGHPNEQVLDRLVNRGIEEWRTDMMGQLELRWRQD